MARLKEGILGPLSGKLGPVVGASWNGIAYVRSAPRKKRKKSRKRSQAQMENEMKFKYVNDWMVPFHPYLTVGFQNLAIRKTAITAAFSVNYHQAIKGVYPDLSVDYAKVVVSAGSLIGLNFPEAILTAKDSLEVNWLQNVNGNAAYSDQIMLVVYSPELKIADGFIGGTNRADQKCVFKFDSRLIGGPLEIYLSVTSLDRKKIANSVYLGRVEPL